MLRHLLESQPRRRRSRGAALVSLTAHAAVIASAVAATASARLADPAAEPVTDIIYVPVPPREPAPVSTPTTPASPVPVTPEIREIVVPPIEVPATLPPVPPPGTIWREPIIGPIARPGVPGAPDSTFLPSTTSPLGADQVDRAAAPLGAMRSPRYPEILRRDRVEGSVLASYVIDAQGKVEPESFRALDVTHPLFEQAVRTTVLASRFRPAEVGGRRVRQLVEQRFVFTLSR